MVFISYYFFCFLFSSDFLQWSCFSNFHFQFHSFDISESGEYTKEPIIPLQIDFYFLSFPQFWPGASYQIMVAA